MVSKTLALAVVVLLIMFGLLKIGAPFLSCCPPSSTAAAAATEDESKPASLSSSASVTRRARAREAGEALLRSLLLLVLSRPIAAVAEALPRLTAPAVAVAVVVAVVVPVPPPKMMLAADGLG